MARGGISQTKARQEIGELLDIDSSTLMHTAECAQVSRREQNLGAQEVDLRSADVAESSWVKCLGAAAPFEKDHREAEQRDRFGQYRVLLLLLAARPAISLAVLLERVRDGVHTVLLANP